MLRRISTKLVLAVLTAVVLPFVAFAIFIDQQMADRLTRHVVQQALMGLVKDLGGQLDYFVNERHQDVQLWADSLQTIHAIDDYVTERRLLDRARIEGTEGPADPPWNARSVALLGRGEIGTQDFSLRHPDRGLLTKELDRYVESKHVYDLILVVAEDGRLVTCTSRAPEGPPLDEGYLQRLFATDFAAEPWFRAAVDEDRIATVDHHVSPYRLYEYGPDQDLAWNYHIAFAAPVHDAGRVRGVLFALVNWKFVEDLVSSPVVKNAFQGLVGADQVPSAYAWIWARDADTILGHPKRELYYQSVSRDVGLPQMTRAVLASTEGWGLYPEYRFQGEEKNAAFKRCEEPADGGFGWIVGVGIDNDDIYATATELRNLLLGGTAVVLLMATLWTMVIARRTTAPVLELQRSARRVAGGDLDVQAAVRSQDELGELTRDFNVMVRELKAQRERLVKAEKDAAWREMARQIAHDIKNPLTPIQLSLDLLDKVRRDRAEGSDEILERTMELMRRQVENLRQIAGDFYEFTGGRKPRPEPVDVGLLLDEVLHLHDAWAVSQGVHVQREGEGGVVTADLGKLRRVFVNIVSNALQAMPDGGELLVDASRDDGAIRIDIRDTGAGIPAEVREHLFEPYFTTKSEGTGLGLAISKRVIEEMDGTIELGPAPADEHGAGGTLATVRLPAADAANGGAEASPGDGDGAPA